MLQSADSQKNCKLEIHERYNKGNALSGQQKIAVIVPAAAPSTRQEEKIGTADAAFLNIGTNLAIERISSFFASKPNVCLVLGVINSDKQIFSLRPFESIKVVGVGNTASVCDTILSLLDCAPGDWCLINPITTIPTSHLSAAGAIYFGQEQIPKENWASMTLHGKQKPLFHAKTEEASIGLPSFPFTGRIYARKEDIRTAIDELGQEQRQDLIYLAEALFKHGHAAIRYERWLDAGHEATYADSKLLAISSRFFNSLSYDKATNTIRKRSEQKDKVSLEGRFYSECPPSLKRYFPLVLDSTDKGDYWELALEYIGYPSLAEVFLYGNIGLNCWRRVIKALSHAFDDFYSKSYVYRYNASWLYSDKTASRQNALEEILHQVPDHYLRLAYYSGFTVNGLDFPPVKEGFRILQDNLKVIETSRPLCIGHGDLCFNNILIDPIYGSLKLIDPKATLDEATGQCGLMDPLYDLSKLNHSFMGLYDSIVNNLYSLLAAKPFEFKFFIYTPANFEYILGVFQDELLLERIDEQICKLATANLFLSMLPLHKENPQRMLALAIVGMAILFYGNINKLHLDQ